MSTNDPAVQWLESQPAYVDDFDEYRNGDGPADWWAEACASMHTQPLYQVKGDDCLCDDGEDCSIIRSHDFRQDWREGREMGHTQTLLWARSASLAHDTHAHLLISKDVGDRDVPAARPTRPPSTHPRRNVPGTDEDVTHPDEFGSDPGRPRPAY